MQEDQTTALTNDHAGPFAGDGAVLALTTDAECAAGIKPLDVENVAPWAATLRARRSAADVLEGLGLDTRNTVVARGFCKVVGVG